MAKLNRVELIGNLGKESELRYLANGQPKVEFTLAVDDSYKKGNDWVNQTQWMNVVLWGDQAERMSQQLTKGTPVYVEGKLTTRSWDDDKGQKHYKTEIVARQVAVLVRPPKRDEAQTYSQDPDDLPFEQIGQDYKLWWYKYPLRDSYANKDGLMTFVKRHCIRPEKDYE